MIYIRLHGRTSVILQFYLMFCFCCGRCQSKPYRRPEFCEMSNINEPTSFLWTVRRDPPSFLFGTIHVPYSRVWDYIPENVKKAFEYSENVYFELDLTEPATISALTNCQLLPKGENLSDVLPKDIYRRLKRHLDYVKNMIPRWMTADQRGRGLYADYLFNAITGNWERKRPVWVMLMVNSLTEGDIKSRGIPVLDLYLAQQAERMNKLTGAVEQVEEQCIPLNGLNISQVLFALNQTLFQHENVRSGNLQVLYTTDDLIKHYNCGDLNAVIFNQDTAQVPNFINSSLHPVDQVVARNIDKYFRDELIFKRNERMAERVMQLLLDNPAKSYFFAFGAGHFLGNNTILDMMETAGFFVEHIPVDRKIKLWKKKPKPPIKVLPEFRALRDFSLASNSLDDKSDEQSGPHSNPNGRNKFQKKVLPPRSASSPSSRKHRNFNDLWVRLDPYTTSSSQMLPREVVGEEAFIVQQSLRVWYGLPINEAAVQSIIWFPLFTVLLVNFLANMLFQQLYYCCFMSTQNFHIA